MATIQRTPTRSTQPLLALCADAVGVEEEEDVLAGDLGQAGHDQDVGGHDAPAAHPPGLRAEGPGPPRECGATVRVGVVQLLVAVGDEQHRDEGDDGDDGRLEAVDGDDHEARGWRPGCRPARWTPPPRPCDEMRPSAPPFRPLSPSGSRLLRTLHSEIRHDDPFGRWCPNDSQSASEMLRHSSARPPIPSLIRIIWPPSTAAQWRSDENIVTWHRSFHALIAPPDPAAPITDWC